MCESVFIGFSMLFLDLEQHDTVGSCRATTVGGSKTQELLYQ